MKIEPVAFIEMWTGVYLKKRELKNNIPKLLSLILSKKGLL
jgi:hypothetical protein